MKFTKYLKKSLVSVIAVSIVGSSLTACGANQSDETSGETNSVESTSASGSTDTSSEKPYSGVKLKWALTDNSAGSGETKAIIELLKQETGIEIEPYIMPTTNAGEIDKLLVSLMSGDDVDIIERTPAQLKEFYSADVLEPLDELAANAGYDMNAVYGDGLIIFEDQTYGIPTTNDIWLTFYNKKIFDDAGVPYPSAENWTWDKYIETAKKINNPEKGIWGSFMLDYDNYHYMEALQKGAEAYNADGTSNFDDPLFKESMKFYYDFGNVLKIQPDSIEYASGVYPYNSFMTTDKIGMFVCGGWVASTLTDQEKYPRDWEAGILPMPYPEGSEPSTLTVSTNCAIPSTSKNKEAAFEAIKFIAENKYSLGYGRVPAKQDMTDEEIDSYITEQLLPMFEHDKLTLEDFKISWFDKDRKLIYEKFNGPADTTINQIWIEEGQLYGQGAKSLDDTMKSIKERSDTAIAEANEK